MSQEPDPADNRRFFAVTAPGLETVTAEELRHLGALVLRVTRGGVTFAGPLEIGFRANLWSRTAVAVRLRLARFHAPSEPVLAKRVGEIDWAAYMPRDERVDLMVKSTSSRLSHTGRLAAVVRGVLPAGNDSPGPGQEVQLRLVHDTCTLSMDMSGELLHRRGYRQETSRAPLRESLAAGLILAAGWDPATPFMDPMCGSGTFPIEAALIALHFAPGLERGFACERWPSSGALWEKLRLEARALAHTAPPAPIIGSDRNAGAVGVARRNAERAGVAAHLTLERRELAAIEPPPERRGLFLTNPPFGRRVAEVKALEPLYAEIGQVLVTRFAGWKAAIVSADRRLDRRIELPRLCELEFRHGGLRCRLVQFDAGSRIGGSAGARI